MKTFALPDHEGMPLKIADIKVDLQSTPPLIHDRILESIDEYISAQSGAIKVEYKDAPIKEGYLNIYICQFKAGKYRLHIFGKINGRAFRTEKEFRDTSTNSLGIMNEKIKYVLDKSRNILKNYYVNANMKSLEEHLNAFLWPM
jgi:hypothetical protein